MLRFHVHVRAVMGLKSPPSPAFDDVYAKLQALSRMFIEPDGSFVWRGVSNGGQWQVDGNLIDRGPTLDYVELKGYCPQEPFDELLRAVGWPEVALSFQLPQ